MMIIARGVNAVGFECALRTMFQARKKVFVDLLGWDVPVLAGMEIDQFDTADAIYMIALGESGEHLGSLRLLPSTRPHILSELFSGLCEEAVPRGRAIYEITRLCLDPSLKAVGRRKVRNRLATALTEFAAWHGIESYTGVAEMGWLSQILSLGWRALPLGLPKNVNGSMLGALQIHIEPDTLNRLLAAGTYLPTGLALESDALPVAA